MTIELHKIDELFKTEKIGVQAAHAKVVKTPVKNDFERRERRIKMNYNKNKLLWLNEIYEKIKELHDKIQIKGD